MKKILILSALLLAGAALRAQNLNPVVEVTNAYAREATGIEKPSQLMDLPDSIYKFNLNFDYSVTNPTYQGAYEFHPYLVQMAPGARLSGEQKFYLKAGAGYSLHPELDLVWNPVRKENFRMNLYATHQSYVGNYRMVSKPAPNFTWDGTLMDQAGMRGRSALGADFVSFFKGGRFTADLNYRNIVATSYITSGVAIPMHHRGRLQARMESAPGAKFLFNVGTRLSFLGSADQQEFGTVTDATLGFKAFRLGLGLETASYSSGTVLKGELIPHYVINKKRLTAQLGVKLSYVISPLTDYPQKGGILFPDVQLTYRLADAAILQAAATGGNRLITYDSILDSNPYLSAFEWRRDITVERLHLMGGIRGSAGARFSYDAKAGFKWISNAFSWSYYTLPSSGGFLMTPTVAFVDRLLVYYGDVKLNWLSENWDASAHVYYGYTPVPTLGDTQAEQNVFVPASFKAQGHVFYTWMGRIKAGVTLEARSKMIGKGGGIPAYQDLGIYAEYAATRHLGFWLRGGNLLNQAIQRIPFHAEGGIYATGGIKLTF